MTTRRTFLSAIASFAAAAGLSRLAGGEKASEPVPAGKPANHYLAACRRLGIDPFAFEQETPHPHAGLHVTIACMMPDGQVCHRIAKFDNRGRVVEVSPVLSVEA